MAKAKKPAKPRARATTAAWPAQFRWPIYVESIVLVPDAIIVANASYTRLGFLRRGSRTPEQVEVLGAPRGLALLPNRSELAFAFDGYESHDHGPVRPAIVIVDAATGAQHAALSGVVSALHAFCASPDGEHIAVHGYPDAIQIWRIADVRAGSGKPRVSLEGTCGGRMPEGLAFIDAETLTWFDDDKQARCSLDGDVTFVPHPARGANIVIGPTGALAYCSNFRTGVVSADGTPRWENVCEHYAEQVCFSPDGKLLVTATSAWDWTFGKKRPSKRPAKMEVAFLAIHDAATGKRLAWKPRPNKRTVRALAVDDERIVIGRDSGCEVFAWADLRL